MSRSFIVAAHRTAVVPRGGAFAALDIHQLAAPVISSVLDTAGLKPTQVDELILGNALGAGGNPARVTALAAGLPEQVAGLSIDRQCSGGLDALTLADAMIRSGQAEIVVAGGVESYSRRPLRHHTFTDGRPSEPYDQPPFTPWPDRDPDMAEAADKLAIRLGISRQEQDQWAIESHRKARTRTGHVITGEIVPICDVKTDSFTRDLTPKLCERAQPIVGNITAANTSVAADAAAFVVMVSKRIADQLSIRPVQFEGGKTLGADPACPGLAPTAAIEAVLASASLQPGDLTTAEIMEAYAVQAIACVRQAGLDPAIVNPGGGSLARGHPIGASGAILAVRLFHELGTQDGYGLAAIAAAGGLGTAVILRA